MLRAPMKLHPRPSLAATGDHTSGQAARLRDRLLPFQLSRPSAPSALATPWVLIRMLCIGATMTILQLVGDSHERCARAGRQDFAVRDTRPQCHATSFRFPPFCMPNPPHWRRVSSSGQPHRPHMPPARVRARDTRRARPRKARRTGSGPQRAPPGRQTGVRENRHVDATRRFLVALVALSRMNDPSSPLRSEGQARRR